ncbi:MAG: PUR family DNA/RNA-binding protein, partial [candidate division WOR-3 bacterium]|nr:PUR family DNA/RNA-binding protein [candidate division WOR-3 bacterium]
MNNERKELFSEKLQAGKRTYFFDVKETVGKKRYLVISESRPAGEKSFV